LSYRTSTKCSLSYPNVSAATIARAGISQSAALKNQEKMKACSCSHEMAKKEPRIKITS
jgi:hypothetical protein